MGISPHIKKNVRVIERCTCALAHKFFNADDNLLSTYIICKMRYDTDCHFLPFFVILVDSHYRRQPYKNSYTTV